MRKEVLVAIIVGFALGLVITFGIWSANKALKTQKEQEQQQASSITTTVTPGSNVTPTPSFFLSIIKPENESVLNQQKITVSGSTIPNAELVILWESGESIIEADDTGNFSTEIGLISGINEINVTALSEDGEETTEIINVVYSTEKI